MAVIQSLNLIILKARFLGAKRTVISHAVSLMRIVVLQASMTCPRIRPCLTDVEDHGSKQRILLETVLKHVARLSGTDGWPDTGGLYQCQDP